MPVRLPAELAGFRLLCRNFRLRPAPIPSPHLAPSPWQPSRLSPGRSGARLCPLTEVYVGASLPTAEAQLRGCLGFLWEKHQTAQQRGNLPSKPQSNPGLHFCSLVGLQSPSVCPTAAAGDLWLGGENLVQTRACKRAGGAPCRFQMRLGAVSVARYQFN